MIWQTTSSGQHYEVRSAGNSIRLYTNGVFHSQWNSGRPLAGHIWDLLFLPVMLHPSPHKLNKILVLGVGGGAVINVLNHFLRPKKIVGIDLDSVHLRIARRFFLKDKSNVSLHRENACSYIEKNDNSHADLIVEDLFCGAQDDPSEAIRAVNMDEVWLSTLSDRLNENGVLVINFENPKQLRQALNKKSVSACDFESVYRLTTPQYENAIGVCLKKHQDKSFFNQNIERFIVSHSKSQRAQLKFTLTRVI